MKRQSLKVHAAAVFVSVFALALTAGAQTSLQPVTGARGDVLIDGDPPLTRAMETQFADAYCWALQLDASDTPAVYNLASSFLESTWRKKEKKDIRYIAAFVGDYLRDQSLPSAQQQLVRLRALPEILQVLGKSARDRTWNQFRERVLIAYSTAHPNIAPGIPVTRDMLEAWFSLATFMQAAATGAAEIPLSREQRSALTQSLISAYPQFPAQVQATWQLYFVQLPYLSARVRYSWPSLPAEQKAELIFAWYQGNSTENQPTQAASADPVPSDNTEFAEKMVNKTYFDNMLINNVGAAMMGQGPKF